MQIEAPPLVPPLPELEAPTTAPAPDEKPKVTRRRRVVKVEAELTPVVEPLPVSEPQPEEPSKVTRRRRATTAQVDAVSVADAPVADEPLPEEMPKVTRRRRATRAEAEPTPVLVTELPKSDEPQPDKPQRTRRKKVEPVVEVPGEASDEPETNDDVAEALAAIEKAVRAADGAEHAEVAEPDERDEILSSLAEAIASGSDEFVEFEADAEADDDEAPRRRRRRGGRRRRRGSRADDIETEDTEAIESEGDEPSEEADVEEGDEPRSTSTRRRRRRRRRGEDATGEDEPGTDVVVKVRDPRRSSSDTDQVTGIEGSTRLEAKRQRRKESRAAGRRRAPILSEAEFLARRESVDRKMVIRQGEDYTQLAVLEDGVLVEHYVDRASATSLIGNIYLGKVQNVLPSMEAAFIDIGRGRNAVLYAGEIDWDGLGHAGERKVEEVFKSGQSVLVQVSKDPIGAKGARLTSHISLPGRYIVYAPGGHLSGISRKLPDTERNRLKDILGGLIGDEASVIVRTAAEGVSEEELVRDVNRLKAQWEVIEKKAKQGSAPHALYAEPDLTLRIVRDLFTEDFNEMIVQGNGSAEDAFDAISAYVSHIAPHLGDRVRKFEASEGNGDCFTNFRIDEQIAKALERKVFLPSGGSLIIDRTEAMTVIDVNTGKFTGTGGNLEATVTSNNLEAAEEIVRQLRLRDVGGIIVIDFIDMVLPSNRELLLRRLVECLGRDRTRHQVAEVTSLGLVQLTRKKIGTGLAEAFTEQCECCGGRGYHRFEEPVESQAPADGGERPARRRRRGGNGS